MRALGLILAAALLAGCAMIQGGTPATDPSKKDYPCGPRGSLCLDTMPHSCCLVGVCAHDDDGPYCDETPPEDPADPTTLRRAHVRGARVDVP